ncbi:hypothetical protein OF829_05410 [Sphingomonas sp. LB-2]|uniref:hypothetical protein n=1 Tax=Sphingomonas caeni TaxID=2984949 RepID=UPI0022314EE9|nr:hypothetical protein [Sphingomonas caeni]MCW3846668.1 hypothetical protein [Sphingomonas caeni]
MLRQLDGLTIARAEGRWPDEAAADIHWKHSIVDALPGADGSHAASEDRADGRWTVHVYAEAGCTHQRFAISPDGACVESQGIARTRDDELWGLMSEPVMRTLFRLRGIPSFHAASLSRGGRTILIAAEKGGGKSTLSAALVRGGWTLLSDDLTRVERIGGEWRAHAGYNQLKLHADSKAALGIGAAELGWRWHDADPRLPGNKLVWKLPEAPDLAPRRIDEIFVLQRRDPLLTAPRQHRVPAVHAMLALQPHLSCDPFLAETAPRRGDMAALLSLSAGVACTALTMPDDLQRLAEFAGAI